MTHDEQNDYKYEREIEFLNFMDDMEFYHDNFPEYFL